MKSNRWGVYKVKSRAKSSEGKALSPSTAGKAALEGAKVGQDKGKRENMPIIMGKVKTESYPQAKMPLSLATKPKKAKVVRNLPVKFKHDNRLQLLNSIISGWVVELKFHPVRRWRFDYAHEKLRIAVEIEGAVWANGRHTRGAGYLADCEKYNAAQILGYRVMRYAPKQLAEMADDIKKILEGIC